MKTKLLLLSLAFILFFTLFSYSVAKERWQRIDFDTMVKLQDKIPRQYDGFFSYFSLLGSVELTIGLSLMLAFSALTRRRWRAIAGWLMIIPATAAEIFGKLVLFHPGPPVFFHRSILPTGLPSFYVQTNFSYPSGHITRTIFIVTIFLLLVLFSWKMNFINFRGLKSAVFPFQVYKSSRKPYPCHPPDFPRKTVIAAFIPALRKRGFLPAIIKIITVISIILIALMMALTRIYLGEHWLSDVLGGGLLGAATGFFAAGLILRPKKV